MKDVARAAGVSATTVSFVLNGQPSIPEATRVRVLAKARDLGYRRNSIAAGLRRERTDTIGLISDTIATTPFGGQMIQGAQDAAWKSGKVLVVINTGGEREIEDRAVAELLERRVDGIIYASMFHQLVEPPAALQETAAVLLDARSAQGNISSVVPDEIGGARAAVVHLLAAGHRRIGFLQNKDQIPATAERMVGYAEALVEAGIQLDRDLVASASSVPGYDAVEAAEKLLTLSRPPTALFCFNDRMAWAAIRATRRLNLRVPEDVSIVGFDNQLEIAPYLEPPLTTIQLPHFEMGAWAVTELLDGSGTNHARLACPLVERASVATKPSSPNPKSHRTSKQQGERKNL